MDSKGNFCQICGNDRYIEKCHIVPRSVDVTVIRYGLYPVNILDLCPNHHKYFDNGLLTKDEYEKIKEQVELAAKTIMSKMEKEYKEVSDFMAIRLKWSEKEKAEHEKGDKIVLDDLLQDIERKTSNYK